MKEIIILTALFTTVMGIIIGATKTGSNREMGKSGCEYKSYAAYFPGHLIGCELFRDRTIK